MKIIRDDVSLFVVPLMIDWHLPTTCMVKDCGERATTIVLFDESEVEGGMGVVICEKHHQQSVAAGKFQHTIVGGQP